MNTYLLQLWNTVKEKPIHAAGTATCTFGTIFLFMLYTGTFNAARFDASITNSEDTITIVPRIVEPLPAAEDFFARYEGTLKTMDPVRVPLLPEKIVIPPVRSAAPEEMQTDTNQNSITATPQAGATSDDETREEISVPTDKAQAPTDDFPAFGKAVYPVSRIPDWGAMRSPAEWNRTYKELKDEDFVDIPSYNLADLTIPLETLATPLREENIPIITAKLFFSTRYFAKYDLDADEFSAVHPGVDLKLARGTPLGAIAGGRVYDVLRDSNLGLYVMIEHHTPDGEKVFSIYGHLDSAAVTVGEDVVPGQYIGNVGMTGNTSSPHVHLQIDKDTGNGHHVRYWPATLPTYEEADKWGYNPIRFITKY